MSLQEVNRQSRDIQNVLNTYLKESPCSAAAICVAMIAILRDVGKQMGENKQAVLNRISSTWDMLGDDN